MKILGNNRKMEGELYIPGDKSISHRALILLSLAKGGGLIKNILRSEDIKRTRQMLEQLGVVIYERDEGVFVEGRGLYGLKESKEDLFCGNSGTTMRLMAGILSGQKFNSILRGDSSLEKRPMDRIIEPLEKMGAKIISQDRMAPLKIEAVDHIESIDYDMKIASAQVKSAILLAGLYSKGRIVIREQGLSRNHTENMLKYLGVDLELKDKLIVMDGKRDMTARDIYVAGDISSAAYFMVGASILEGSSICLKNVGINETRDGILDVLLEMGGKISIKNRRLLNNEKLADIYIESTDLEAIKIRKASIGSLIDEIPIISVAAAFAKGVTEIEAVGELRVKEIDRLEAIIRELRKAGVNIWSSEDNLYIEGGGDYRASNFDSYGDHRMAMAMSIFALKLKGVSQIKNSDCVAISYPNFFSDLELLLK